MRHHCINKKRLRMAFYNGNKQERGSVLVPHLQICCQRWFRPIARWKDYGHYGHYGTQYEIRIFQTEYKYQIYPLSSAVRMFHVQMNISNRTPQSGVLLQDVTVAQLVKKLPVNYATRRSAPVYDRPPPLAVLSHIHFNINLPSMPSSSHWFLPFGLLEQRFVSISQCWI